VLFGLPDVALPFRLAFICFTSPASSWRLIHAVVRLKRLLREKVA